MMHVYHENKSVDKMHFKILLRLRDSYASISSLNMFKLPLNKAVLKMCLPTILEFEERKTQVRFKQLFTNLTELPLQD